MKRRDFIWAVAAAAAAGTLEGCRGRRHDAMEGTMEGLVPFYPAVAVPDAAIKLATNLANLAPDTRVVPNRSFYVRTSAGSKGRPHIIVSGGNGEDQSMGFHELVPEMNALGIFAMESPANAASNNFGLLGCASLSGLYGKILSASLKPRLKPGSRLQVMGDGDVSWIFSMDEVAAGALVSHMNEGYLEPEHGAPYRWFMPGWFGCCNIKWVHTLRLVDDNAPATPFMQSMAAATLQDGVPKLARDFKPCRTGVAAVPLRVERWKQGEAVRYRVVGLRWGGTDDLQIRFSSREPYQPVEDMARTNPATPHAWSWWHHTWTPAAGEYTIQLRPRTDSVFAPRLRRGDYDRKLRV